ncbi:MAG: hypothetical protein CME68_05175 [Halobacteriovoraceae bacterium]|nr:hypothetical protein [Halobacteriovoraceae bacterium]
MKISGKNILPYWQDIYSVFITFLSLFLLIAPFFMELSLPLSIFWIGLSCLINFIVNLIDHNHIHVPTFGYKFLNTFFGLLLTVTRGASERFTFIIHNLNHHRYEGSKEDWFWPGNEGNGVKIFRPFIYAYKTGRRFKKEGQDLFKKMDQQFGKIRKVENTILFCFVAFALSFSISKTFFFLIIPWIFGNYFIVFTNLLFHKGCDPTSKMNLSKNYTNPFENFLFLNGGYHTIHHLYPRIHWSQLPVMHEKHIAPNIKKELVLNSMVMDTYRSYFKNDLFKEGLHE